MSKHPLQFVNTAACEPERRRTFEIVLEWQEVFVMIRGVKVTGQFRGADAGDGKD